MSGISLAQGPHQLTQKFSSTGLPLKSARVRVAPSASVMVKSGAGVVAALAPLPSPVSSETSASAVASTSVSWTASVPGNFYLLVIDRRRQDAVGHARADEQHGKDDGGHNDADVFLAVGLLSFGGGSVGFLLCFQSRPSARR